MSNYPTKAQLNVTYCNNFPSDVLKWIKKNSISKPQICFKLMKVCKYFQHKPFPYSIISGISNNENGRWSTCKMLESRSSVTESINMFSENSLWITKYLNLYFENDPISKLLPKIAVCEAKHLYLCSQNLTFNEFKFLADSKTLENVNFSQTAIVDERNNEIAALEKILKYLPNVKNIFFDKIVPSISSVKNAAKINISKMKLFDATRVSETFNFIKFSKFIKIHCFVQYRIFYDNNIELSKTYKSEIQNYVNELDAEDFIKYPPPDIYFPGQTLNNGIEKLVDLRNNYVNDKTKQRHVPTRIATKRRFA